LDIVVHNTSGFLADSLPDYVHHTLYLINLDAESQRMYQKNAWQRSTLFQPSVFESKLSSIITKGIAASAQNAFVKANYPALRALPAQVGVEPSVSVCFVY
jgi:hypothetical protein